MALLFIYRKRW